ncbi:MAG: hypothetical protein QOG42_756 [Solirubrobacteraceae bacterium]|jgi:hypothetical protein|nr:hypothetical protein [Solirubrobacteraceae bacterium]
MARRLLLLLALMLAAGAALALPAGAQEAPNPPSPYIVGGDAQRALDKARATWKAAKIASYRYEARRTCFCPTSGWHTVNVRRGMPSKGVHSDVKDIATVPRLFRQIQRAIDRKAHGLTVTYGAHGVPKQISIDPYENLIDEEQYFTTRAFKRR